MFSLATTFTLSPELVLEGTQSSPKSFCIMTNKCFRLLATFLGVLGMTVVEALDEFINIYKKILTPDVELTPVLRSNRLESSLRALLKRRGMPEGQTLVGTGRCCT